MQTRALQFILLNLLVLLVCGLPIDLFGQTPFFNYRKYLVGPQLTLSLHVDSVNATSGYVKINGVDMGTLAGHSHGFGAMVPPIADGFPKIIRTQIRQETTASK